MQVLIFALLALAANAEHWGHDSYSHSPSYSYVSSPYSSWSSGYGSSLYGGYSYGLGGYSADAYQPVSQGYSTVAGPAKISFSRQVAAPVSYAAGPAVKYVAQAQPVTTVVEERVAPAVTYVEPKPVVTYVQPKPAVTYVQPKPAVTYVQPKPAVTYVQPKPAVTYVQPKQVVTYVQPKPAVTYIQPKPAVTYVQPKQVMTYVQPKPAVTYVQPKPAVTYVQPKPAVTYVQPRPAVKYVEAKPEVTYVEEVKPAVTSYVTEARPAVYSSGSLGSSAFQRQSKTGQSTGEGVSRISFTQDFSKVTGQARQITSGVKPTTFQRVATPVLYTAPRTPVTYTSGTYGENVLKNKAQGFSTNDGASKITFTQDFSGISDSSSRPAAPSRFSSTGGSILKQQSLGPSAGAGGAQMTFTQDFSKVPGARSSAVKPARPSVLRSTGGSLSKKQTPGSAAGTAGGQVSFTLGEHSGGLKPERPQAVLYSGVSALNKQSYGTSAGTGGPQIFFTLGGQDARLKPASYSAGRTTVSRGIGQGIPASGQPIQMTFYQDLSRGALQGGQHHSAGKPVVSTYEVISAPVAGRYSSDDQSTSGIGSGYDVTTDGAKITFTQGTGVAGRFSDENLRSGQKSTGFSKVTTYQDVVPISIGTVDDQSDISQYSYASSRGEDRPDFGLSGQSGRFHSSSDFSDRKVDGESPMFVAIPVEDFAKDDSSFKSLEARDDSYGVSKDSVFMLSADDDGRTSSSKSSEGTGVTFVDVKRSDNNNPLSNIYNTGGSGGSGFSYISGLDGYSSQKALSDQYSLEANKESVGRQE